MNEVQLSRLHCGLFHTPFAEAMYLMPEVAPILEECPVKEGIVDVKVHMLMPGQWPCIPNWHEDFTPRVNGVKKPELRDSKHKMYFWLSGPPLTEFKDGREIKPCTWIEFNQFDTHRGTKSEYFCWRMFIRVVPRVLCPPATGDQRFRRHCQVYLDAGNFEW